MSSMRVGVYTLVDLFQKFIEYRFYAFIDGVII